MQNQNQIYNNFTSGRKLLIVLIDPDKFDSPKAMLFFSKNKEHIDLIFVGGSLLEANRTENVVKELKSVVICPVVIFPGSSMQVVSNADAILFLSLISGRNAEFLIGHHVQAAPLIYNSGIEAIPTSYILVDGGKTTTVQYITQTLPVPADKPEIAAATALAGKYSGHKLVYLEAGSGAINHVSETMVAEVSQKTQLPVIAGGGIRNAEMAEKIVKAGATAIVVGTLYETNPDEIVRIAEKIHSL